MNEFKSTDIDGATTSEMLPYVMSNKPDKQVYAPIHDFNDSIHKLSMMRGIVLKKRSPVQRKAYKSCASLHKL
jgi:hypothetical protein